MAKNKDYREGQSEYFWGVFWVSVVYQNRRKTNLVEAEKLK